MGKNQEKKEMEGGGGGKLGSWLEKSLIFLAQGSGAGKREVMSQEGKAYSA